MIGIKGMFLYLICEVRKLGLILKPVKTRKKYEEIVDQIRQHIDEGNLKPGDKLPSERDLVESFRVSRASIREAFSALEMMGLVEVRTGEGSYVCHHKKEFMPSLLQGTSSLESGTVFDLLEVRKMIEVEAVGYATKRVTEVELEQLEKELNIMMININGQGTAWERSDHLFHYDIAKATHNKLTVNLMENITDHLKHQIRIFNPVLYKEEYTPELLYQEHADIFEAIKDRNVGRAREKMYKHLSGVEDAIMKGANIA